MEKIQGALIKERKKKRDLVGALVVDVAGHRDVYKHGVALHGALEVLFVKDGLHSASARKRHVRLTDHREHLVECGGDDIRVRKCCLELPNPLLSAVDYCDALDVAGEEVLHTTHT